MSTFPFTTFLSVVSDLALSSAPQESFSFDLVIDRNLLHFPCTMDWKSHFSDAVAATRDPHCAAHFLTKFENQSEDKRLHPLLMATSSSSLSSTGSATCLMVSKKHSGSLLMAPPFYSKNATANKFSRLGAITMHAYMCAVWDEPKSQPNTFLAWWADAEARGLCYSFELVVPRALGDHGATPKAAYLVLTTVAQTKPGAVFDSDDYHHREQVFRKSQFASLRHSDTLTYLHALTIPLWKIVCL